ncbi:MAG TPA: site-specific integrase [Terriglobales bacterium]|nr:site-specific integrase [Terriglobales bacterium]
MSNRHSHRRVSCSFLKNHVLPRWGATPIDRVQAREVELWLKATSLQPKTKAHLRSILSSLIDFAMWSNLIPAKLNPMSLVRIQGVSKRARKPRILTVDEFHQLVDQMREPSRTIALVCVCLGLRISEALALRWEDVDWLGSKLSVRRAIVEQHVDEPKTAGSTATFPLSAELLSKLQLWRRSTEFSADSDWMFASPVKIGRLPYSYTGVWRVLQEAARKANLGKLGTHSFRHTYRSWLGSVGTPLEVQQKAMRHTDLRTTMIYGSVEDGRIDEALEKVSSLVFANSTQTARRSS